MLCTSLQQPLYERRSTLFFEGVFSALCCTVPECKHIVYKLKEQMYMSLHFLCFSLVFFLFFKPFLLCFDSFFFLKGVIRVGY